MADVSLEISSDRISAGQEAGNKYTHTLESIRDDLDKADNTGTSLGRMVEAQLQMTEADTRYNIEMGIPNKVAKAVNDASKSVK